MKRIPYDELTLQPHVIAKMVVTSPYDGRELSNNPAYMVTKVESLRQQMPELHQQAFVQACDNRCREAYEIGADWFMACLNGNRGRDQLYNWVKHWLASYLIGRMQPVVVNQEAEMTADIVAGLDNRNQFAS